MSYMIIPGTQYTLPIASPTVLGGVKVGSGLTIDGTGILAATAQSTPIATTTTVGTVKVPVSGGLAIDGAGNITADIATVSALGQVIVGSGLSVTGGGTVSVTNPALTPNSGLTVLGVDTVIPATTGNVSLVSTASLGIGTWMIDAGCMLETLVGGVAGISAYLFNGAATFYAAATPYIPGPAFPVTTYVGYRLVVGSGTVIVTLAAKNTGATAVTAKQNDLIVGAPATYIRWLQVA